MASPFIREIPVRGVTLAADARYDALSGIFSALLGGSAQGALS